MRSEIAQLESVANEKADKLRILSAIARVPFVAVFETVQIPMRVVDWTASAISDILIETANLVLIVILLLMPPSRENAPMASSENHAKQATGSKHNRKHRQRPPRSPKRRSELDPKSEHARKESMDILLKRFVIAEEDMDEERQRAAKDAIGHAQAQMRAKMKRDRITDMRLRDSKQRESEDFAAELFANVPGLSVGTRDMRPMSSSSSDTHERQASWELHNRQKKLNSPHAARNRRFGTAAGFQNNRTDRRTGDAEELAHQKSKLCSRMECPDGVLAAYRRMYSIIYFLSF